jgi:tetratricopeptide (TPR) repeat protein
VARAIAGEIKASFAPADERRFAAAPSLDPKAVEHYLKGRYQWNRRSPASLSQALTHFREAVALQPDYAAAHAAIAETLVVMPAFGIMPPHQAFNDAIAAANKAIALDARLAEAYAGLAYARLHALDRDGAEAAFQQALTVNPGYANAHFWYAAAAASAGRFDEAIAEAKRAEALDPVSPIVLLGTSWIYHLARRFDDEVAQARAVLTLEPNFLMGHYRLGEGLLQLGRMEEALAALQKARELSDDNPDHVAAVAYARARMGRKREAEEALRGLLRLRNGTQRYVSAHAIGLVYTGLGNRDEAIAWLERARHELAWGMAFLGVEPDFDPLRSDRRFAALVAR